MGFTFKPSWPASGNAVDADLDQIRDHWHYVLSIAASGSIVIPGWQTTVQGTDKSQPDSITLTRGTKKIIIYYTWSGNSVSAIQFCYDNGVGETSPSVTCYPAQSFYYDDSGNPYGTVDKDLPASLKTGLVSWWTLDESSGLRADSHGSNDLSDTGTAASAAGKQSNAAQFVAADSDYLGTSSFPGIVGGVNDWSIAGWFYFDTLPGGSSLYTMFGMAASAVVTNSQLDWALVYNDSSDTFNIQIFTGSTVRVCEGTTHGAASTGTWYFIYAYHDSAALELGISVNDGTVDTFGYSGTPNSNEQRLNVGRLCAAFPYYTDGRIDELAYWSRVLTSDEVTALYQSGSGVTYAQIP